MSSVSPQYQYGAAGPAYPVATPVYGYPPPQFSQQQHLPPPPQYTQPPGGYGVYGAHQQPVYQGGGGYGMPPPIAYPVGPPPPPPTSSSSSMPRLSSTTTGWESSTLDGLGRSMATLGPTLANEVGLSAGGPPPPGRYSTGLFSICSEPSITLLGCVVPCYVSARAMAELEGGEAKVDWTWLILGSLFCCPLCNTIETFLTRRRVQKAYNISEPCFERIIYMCFCSNFVICQDAREVRIRTRAAAAAAAAAADGSGSGSGSDSSSAPRTVNSRTSDAAAPLLVSTQPQPQSGYW